MPHEHATHIHTNTHRRTMASLFLYGYPRVSDDDVGLADGGVATADGVALAAPSAAPAPEPPATFEPGKEPIPAGYPGDFVPNAKTTQLLQTAAIGAAKLAAKTGVTYYVSTQLAPLLAGAFTSIVHDNLPDLDVATVRTIYEQTRNAFRSEGRRQTNNLFRRKMVKPARGQRNWGKTRTVRSTGASAKRRATGRSRAFSGGYRRFYRYRNPRARRYQSRRFRRRRWY
jgi:hypothetical protein